MSFTMPAAPAGPPPATKPPVPPKNFYALNPDEQQSLLNEGWQPLEDGSMVHPDGRSRPAFDSPNDFTQSHDLGGYGGAPAGPPATFPAGAASPAGTDPSAPPPTPFDAPQFDRYFATANAGFPGKPGGIGGGAAPDPGNPLGDAAPAPFDAPDVTPPLVINNGSGPANLGADTTKKTPQYGGRIGRRMASRGTMGRRR
jgi:hypothetical protein